MALVILHHEVLPVGADPENYDLYEEWEVNARVYSSGDIDFLDATYRGKTLDWATFKATFGLTEEQVDALDEQVWVSYMEDDSDLDEGDDDRFDFGGDTVYLSDE